MPSANANQALDVPYYNESAYAYAEAKRCLQLWWKTTPESYKKVFEQGAEIKISHSLGDLGSLIELGLVNISGSYVSAEKAICPLGSLFVICDRPDNPSLDRVFPIHFDESYFLASWINVNRGDVVLDLGAGSGILAMISAQKGASKVFASDINPKALSYIELSLKLNGLENSVQLVDSDIFSHIEKKQFDIIASNPPFVPTPNHSDYFIHSDGGELGTKFIEKILFEHPEYLSKNGRLYLLALSLGNNSQCLAKELVDNLNQNTFENNKAWLAPIYNQTLDDLSLFTCNFKEKVNYKSWLAALKQRRFNNLGYYAIYCGGDSANELARFHEHKKHILKTSQGFWSDYSGSMERRLSRYASIS